MRWYFEFSPNNDFDRQRILASSSINKPLGESVLVSDNDALNLLDKMGLRQTIEKISAFNRNMYEKAAQRK